LQIPNFCAFVSINPHSCIDQGETGQGELGPLDVRRDFNPVDKQAYYLFCICSYKPSLENNVPPMACYKFDTCEQIFIFGRNVTDKVSNQKTLYYATSSNLCFCTTWKNGETRKLPFHSNAVLVHCLNSTMLFDFFNILNSQLILMLLYDSLNLVISAFISELLGARFRINEVESAAEVGLCYTHAQCTSALSSQ